MADNVRASSQTGNGPLFKTDEDPDNGHVPATKIELGDDNSFDGYVSTANPMPVEVLATENGHDLGVLLLQVIEQLQITNMHLGMLTGQQITEVIDDDT